MQQAVGNQQSTTYRVEQRQRVHDYPVSPVLRPEAIETPFVLTNAYRLFLHEVVRKSGERVDWCYQCGKCAAGCPVAFAMDTDPTRIMPLVQLGSFCQPEAYARAVVPAPLLAATTALTWKGSLRSKCSLNSVL